jgi:hypothetical protein
MRTAAETTVLDDAAELATGEATGDSVSMGGSDETMPGGSVPLTMGGSGETMPGGSVPLIMGGSDETMPGGSVPLIMGGSDETMPGDSVELIMGGSDETMPGGSVPLTIGGSISTMPGGSVAFIIGGSISTIPGGSVPLIIGGSIPTMPGGSVMVTFCPEAKELSKNRDGRRGDRTFMMTASTLVLMIGLTRIYYEWQAARIDFGFANGIVRLVTPARHGTLRTMVIECTKHAVTSCKTRHSP